MKKLLRQFDSQAEADQAASEDDDRLSCEQRFQIFMQLMAPYYHASAGFQRLYRTDDLKPRTVRDDWGIRLQPLPKSSSDG